MFLKGPEGTEMKVRQGDSYPPPIHSSSDFLDRCGSLAVSPCGNSQNSQPFSSDFLDRCGSLAAKTLIAFSSDFLDRDESLAAKTLIAFSSDFLDRDESLEAKTLIAIFSFEFLDPLSKDKQQSKLCCRERELPSAYPRFRRNCHPGSRMIFRLFRKKLKQT
jgi:hypothetical protein